MKNSPSHSKTGHRINRRLLANFMMSSALSLGAYIAVMPAPQVMAQTAGMHSFNIPSLPLNRALRMLAAQSGIQIAYRTEVASGAAAPAINGTMTIGTALSQLLSSSGLRFDFTNANTVTILDATTVNSDGSLMLDTIDVTGEAGHTVAGPGYMGAPDWVFRTSTGVSVVSTESLETNPARHANDLLDDVAGTYTADNPQDPGININIRGLQDQTRVNTMIDGVRQNFQLAGHSSTGFVYVDPSMIRQVEVDKTVTSGAGGAASLGGQVDFRTVSADDLLEPGQRIGGEIEGTTGTNAYDFSGSLFLAARPSEAVSVTGGFSHKKLGDYDIGHNGQIVGYFRTTEEPADYTASDVWSGLAKVEFTPDDEQSLIMSWLGFKGDYTTGTGQYIDTDVTTNHTLRAAYAFDSASPFIDLKANLWYNHTQVSQFRPARTNYGSFDVDYSLATIGGTLENTSRFELSKGELALNYGFELFQDRTDTDSVGSDLTDDPTGSWFAGAMPIGTRNVYSAFSNAAYDVTNWLNVAGGLRYDAYDLSATGLIWDGVSTYTQETFESSGGRWQPSAAVTVSPTDWLDVFATYSEGYRPPAIMENAASGTHIGSSGQFYIPNPYLKPEESTTWELGANLMADDVFLGGDTLRVKAVGFHRTVDHYISLAHVSTVPLQYTMINAGKESVIDGFELEANYDAGAFFIGGSYTRMNADIDTTYDYHYVIIPGVIEGTMESEGGLVVFIPPEHKASLEAGIRLYDERLQVGGRVTYSGPTVYRGAVGYQSDVDGFTVYDVFGSYAFNEKTKLNFAVNNITDAAYADVLGNPNYGAPGRTATVSLKVKF